VHVSRPKSLTDVQILSCQLHQNAFGGRAPPGLAGGAIALPQTHWPLLWEGEGKKRVVNNNNNNPICKVPECQKTSVALADRNSRAN